ncbi:unnamed protein product [Periconia digitata]|uniref:Uncharacterized protein n=1 Tax=Periconia digitata TaxID=1303443 RepID=A0A9W4ULD4_9PLEO|nr:unnamed protein product [Periconia digitata]
MTTTAWPTTGLEINPPSDIMDIHSDQEPDLPNFDVDIDFDLPRSPVAYNDDVSLKDAVLDGEVDVQTAPADQDDFMVDNEDVIEEDTVAYDEDAVIVDQTSTNQIEAEQHATTPIEDDLIDYSDDEEEHPDSTDITTSKPSGGLETAEPDVSIPAPSAANTGTESVPGEAEEQENVAHETSGDAGQGWQEVDAHQDESHIDPNTKPLDDEYQEEASNQAEVDLSTAHPEDDQGSNAGQERQKQDDPEALTYAAPVSDEIHSPSGEEVELHPVTINYSGAELWLFRHHDYEDSGDFLIEDTSTTNQPISSVLEACRAALGSAVTDDIELGFRLDNFRDIELYQDHSSCAFITLEHLVGLYLQLHAQDGVSEPESFYMTLLSRPRVSALFTALNEAATEGIGHTGLEKAIAAGLTSFNARLSHNPTANSYGDWENDEQHQEQDAEVVNESHDDDEEHGQEEIETEQEHVRAGLDQIQTQNQEGDPQASEQTVEVEEAAVPPQGVTTVDGALPEPEIVTLNATDDADAQSFAITSPQGDKENAGDDKAQGPPSQQEEDDFVDYSDDEGENDAENEQSAHHISSVSSTVQGDEAYTGQDVDQYTSGQALSQHGEEASNEYQDDADAGTYAEYNTLDQGFDAQAYEEEYGEQYGEQEHTDIYGAEDTFPSQYHEENDDTNNYNLGPEDQATEYYDDSTADVDGSYDAQVTIAGGDSTTVEDFDDFDLVNATADVNSYAVVDNDEQIDEYHHNDEDGGSSHAPVATASVDADPVVTLSSESLNLSPQGQKRTIDEVINDVGEATDPSGVLFFPNSSYPWTCADICQPDAKRPRV